MLAKRGGRPVLSRESGTRGPSKTSKSGGVPINALMNIQIRVASNQARASLREIEARVNAIEVAQRRANQSAAMFGAAGLAALTAGAG